MPSGDDEDVEEYKADWVLVTTNKAFLSQPTVANAGEKIPRQPGLRLWTDDYSSLLPVLKLRGWQKTD